MKRRVFTILSALSLVLCVATCVLWVRSYGWADYVCYQRAQGASPYAISYRGAVQWKLANFSYPLRAECSYFSEPDGPFLDNISMDLGRGIARWERPGGFLDWGQVDGRLLGFETGHGTFFNSGIQTVPPQSYTYRYLVTPYWALAGFVGVVPLAGAASFVHRHFRCRRSHDLCAVCGYDLRATPDRCPECGTETKKPGAMAG